MFCVVGEGGGCSHDTSRKRQECFGHLTGRCAGVDKGDAVTEGRAGLVQGRREKELVQLPGQGRDAPPPPSFLCTNADRKYRLSRGLQGLVFRPSIWEPRARAWLPLTPVWRRRAARWLKTCRVDHFLQRWEQSSCGWMLRWVAAVLASDLPLLPFSVWKGHSSPHHHHLPLSLLRIDIQSKCQGSLFSLSASSPPEAAFRRLSLVTDEGLSRSDTPAFKTCDNARTSNHPEVKHSPLWTDGLEHEYILSITSWTLDAFITQRLWSAFMLPGR